MKDIWKWLSGCAAAEGTLWFWHLPAEDEKIPEGAAAVFCFSHFGNAESGC